MHANAKTLIQALQLIRQADNTFDVAEESRLLKEADKLFNEIVTKYPDSALAVQLVTNQFVGDFDFYDFRARIRSLTAVAPGAALTPIAAFRPRRWRGAVLKAETEVRFQVLDPYKRPVSATADSHEVRDVVEVVIRESHDRTVTLLFDPEHNLEERMLAEQFTSG